MQTVGLGLQPLRADSALPGEQPGSAKMVSLDLLLGANSTPVAAKDPEFQIQAVDPADPLVQQLVQDQAFLTAVQTSQLHAAASAAVRLMRVQFTGGSEFKRPPDRRPARDGFGDAQDGAGRGPVPNGRPAPSALVVQRQLVEPRHREALRTMRLEVLGLEDMVPWNSVRRAWKSRRTSWRRQIKQTEVISEFALRLKELRAALLTDDQPLPGCNGAWRAQLEVCIQGKGSVGLLAAAWDELRSTIRAWLDGRCKPPAQSAAQLQAGAVRAVHAMQAAWQAGGGAIAPDGEAGAGSLVQVPLEAIVGGDGAAGLQAVRAAIELEQRVLTARLAGRDTPQLSDGSGEPGEGGAPLVSYFSSLSGPWCDSDAFDSGADSDVMDASREHTDLDSDYDP